MTSSPTRLLPSESDLSVPGSGDLRARRYSPDRATVGTIVWAHGGSWVGGSVPGWDAPCRALAAATGWAVVSCEYRLAPRWPYPAPLDDLVRTVRWLAEAGPVVVGGDSAGATLAAAVAVRLRDEGVPVAAQLLAYPPLDPDCAAPSYHRSSAWPDRSSLLDAWASYRGHVEEPAYLTPWSVPDLTRAAPAAIAVGALDPVADDCRSYAQRLLRAGVPVEFGLFADMGHGLLFARDEHGGFPLARWFGHALDRIHNDFERNPVP